MAFVMRLVVVRGYIGNSSCRNCRCDDVRNGWSSVDKFS